ncbi:MAG TPA: WYL domain-containing protein [Ilumatobacter sp.]|nr:WYL domain-containing protein [Ilumatobacter sp.]
MASTARLLELLSLLQSGANHSGPVIAERLGVTERTIRRDIERLRELGYAVDSRRGATGSYSLGVGGAAVPPLILDREETLALAVCVRAAAGESVTGVAEAAERALAKLHQSLPPRSRAEADALASATVRLPSTGDEVDHSVLVLVTAACREGERLHLEYRDGAGRVTERRVEPYRVVNVERRWYLVAHDLERQAWRTFRLDRFVTVRGTGHGIRLVDPPDAGAFVRSAITTAPYRYHAVIRIYAAIDVVAAHVAPRFAMLEVIDRDTSLLTAGADDLEYLVVRLGVLPFPFTVVEPPELAELMVEVGARMVAAGRPASHVSGSS